jgi:Mn2+/Fe2+ NRAMP family transporter
LPNSFRTCLSDVVGPIELRPSRWPLSLYFVAISLASAAIAISGLTLIAQIIVVLAMAALARYEWRQWQRRARISALRFSPTLIEVFLSNGEQLVVEPPYRCLVTPRCVALQIPLLVKKKYAFSSTMWLQVFDGQMDKTHFCRLRRVLYLQRK